MFPYKRATIDCGFEFVNDIQSINLNLVFRCFLLGVGFLGHGGPGVCFVTDLENGSPAEPKDYIYSIACEV